jgi:hypothetical protein
MDDRLGTKHGIRLLIKKCRAQFRISENIDYYSEKEYKAAERKYVKYCLRGSPS